MELQLYFYVKKKQYCRRDFPGSPRGVGKISYLHYRYGFKPWLHKAAKEKDKSIFELKKKKKKQN